MNKIKLGFAVCGSFCTFSKIKEEIKKLSESDIYDIYPIFSEYAYSTDTRFCKSSDFVSEIEEICKRKSIKSIKEAEPIGPKKILDILAVAPCTGNTLSKLSAGITDTSVTMAVKAHLRNGRPVVIGVSTNDALGTSASNIGCLLSRKNIYFVPMRQDDCIGKPRSLVCDFSKIGETLNFALKNEQIQPIFI